MSSDLNKDLSIAPKLLQEEAVSDLDEERKISPIDFMGKEQKLQIFLHKCGNYLENRGSYYHNCPAIALN